jgi:hypothetical protein
LERDAELDRVVNGDENEEVPEDEDDKNDQDADYEVEENDILNDPEC